MDSKIIDDALDFVKEVFFTDFSGHDYFHTLRVYKMAVRIAQEEGANQEIVALAALCTMLMTSNFLQRPMSTKIVPLVFFASMLSTRPLSRQFVPQLMRFLSREQTR